LFAAGGPLAEFSDAAEEGAVRTDFEFDAGFLGGLFEFGFDAVIAGFDEDDFSGAELLEAFEKLFAEGVGVVEIVEATIDDALAFLRELLFEVAHGRQEEGDAGFVGPDVGGLFGDFGHPNGVFIAVKTVERGRVIVQLIAQNDNKIPHMDYRCRRLAKSDKVFSWLLICAGAFSAPRNSL
jgi:hypothetical protein